MDLRSVAVGAATGATLSAAVAVAIVQHYLLREVKKPRLIHGPVGEHGDEWVWRLQVQALLRDYRPHPLFELSGFLSTVLLGARSAIAELMPQTEEALGRLEKLMLADGGTVSLRWSDEPTCSIDGNSGVGSPIVLLLPGLMNDSATAFVQAAMRHLRLKGFRACALNYRGVGGLDLTSSRIACLDSWRDIPEVVAHIEASYPGASLFAIGYSMGGAILLRHLGEEGQSARFRAAVALATPVDTSGAVAGLESSLQRRILSFAMANGVKVKAFSQLRKSELAGQINMRQFLSAVSLRQIDESSVCVLHKYADAAEYYTYNNPRPVLANIAVPTLIANAEDDPVIGSETLPIDAVRENRNLYLVLTRRGGHVGWTPGGAASASWADRVAARFLESHTGDEIASREQPPKVTVDVPSRL